MHVIHDTMHKALSSLGDGQKWNESKVRSSYLFCDMHRERTRVCLMEMKPRTCSEIAMRKVPRGSIEEGDFVRWNKARMMDGNKLENYAALK